jgi:hypothetical protein
MAAADEDSVWSPNLVRPAPVISSGQPDWSRPERVRALEVILWLGKQGGHGQPEIAAVLRNRQFVTRQEGLRRLGGIEPDEVFDQSSRIERRGDAVIAIVGFQGFGE